MTRRLRIIAAAVAVVLGVTLLILALRTPDVAPSAVANSSGPGAIDTSVRWGLTVDPAMPVPDAVAAADGLLGADASIVNRFISFSWADASQLGVVDELRLVSAPDRAVMITWEPSDPAGQLAEPSLGAIAAGREDERLRAFVAELADFPGPVALRFAHEMNGSWYPWAGDPVTYVQAWRHVRAITSELAPDVQLVWSVNNVDQPASNTLESYWPGADQVDIIGLDGYNCLRGWESPEQIFSDAHRRVSSLAPHLPIWITETASCEASAEVPGSAGQTKAAWIESLFGRQGFAGVEAIVWFDRDKEYDWRIASSAEATTALRGALAAR